MNDVNEVVSFEEKERVFIERTGHDFVTMYKKYFNKLVFFANKICEDTQKAEDISTESFFSALDKIEQYQKDKSQFSTWLFTIAKNIALQEKKNNSKLMSIDIEYDEEGTTLKDFINDDSEQDMNIYDMKQKKAEVMIKHINNLKSPYREIIEMRELNNMSYKDISDLLGENLSTCKSRIRNGRKILMDKVKREFALIENMHF